MSRIAFSSDLPRTESSEQPHLGLLAIAHTEPVIKKDGFRIWAQKKKVLKAKVSSEKKFKVPNHQAFSARDKASLFSLKTQNPPFD